MAKNETLTLADVAIESYAFSENCREDELATVVSTIKNIETADSSSNISKISPQIDLYPNGKYLSEVKVSWHMKSPRKQIHDDQVTILTKKDSKTLSKILNWSKGLKNNPYKYQNISNDCFNTENFVCLPKKSKSSSASSLRNKKSDIFPIVDDRDEIHASDNRSEINTSFSRQTDSTYDSRPIWNQIFQTSNDSDHSYRRERIATEPLLHSKNIRQSTKKLQSKRSSNETFELKESDHPPCEIQPSHSVPIVGTKVVPIETEICNPTIDIPSNNNNSNSTDIESPERDGTNSLDGDDEDSSYATINNEKLPLLMAMGVDCSCGRNFKEKMSRKKKVKGKKKKTEEIWESNQFYRRYESMKNLGTEDRNADGLKYTRQKSSKDRYDQIDDERRIQELDELDHIISRIAPENQTPVDIHLSTIIEGDEDLTRSTHSLQKTTTRIIAVSLQQDNIAPSTTINNILSTCRESFELQSEDVHFDLIQQVKSKDKKADTGSEQQQVIIFEKEVSEKNEVKTKSESSKQSKREKRKVIVKDNEIIIPAVLSGDETSDTSNGGISDITEDYLEIPFSSPLYMKVLKALQEANAETEAKPEQIQFKNLFKNIQSAINIQSEIEEDDSDEELNHLTTVVI